MQWLLKDLVHATCQCSIDVLVFDVASDGDDLWLVLDCHPPLVIKSSYLLGSFISVHEGHVAVHEDQRILVRVIVLNALLDLLQSLLTIVGELTDLLSVWDTQDHQETVDDITVELFVIADQDGGTVQVSGSVYFAEVGGDDWDERLGW